MADEQQTPAEAPSPDQPTSEQLVSDFKKDELAAAAAVQGVDVPSSATKADIAEAIVAQPAATAVPVTVDNRTVRSDNDAVEGGFVDVVDGEHAGRFGSFRQVLEHDKSTGYPTRILVRTRDEFNELLDVAYEHVRPSKRTGGR